MRPQRDSSDTAARFGRSAGKRTQRELCWHCWTELLYSQTTLSDIAIYVPAGRLRSAALLNVSVQLQLLLLLQLQLQLHLYRLTGSSCDMLLSARANIIHQTRRHVTVSASRDGRVPHVTTVASRTKGASRARGCFT